MSIPVEGTDTVCQSRNERGVSKRGEICPLIEVTHDIDYLPSNTKCRDELTLLRAGVRIKDPTVSSAGVDGLLRLREVGYGE